MNENIRKIIAQMVELSSKRLEDEVTKRAQNVLVYGTSHPEMFKTKNRRPRKNKSKKI